MAKLAGIQREIAKQIEKSPSYVSQKLRAGDKIVTDLYKSKLQNRIMEAEDAQQRASEVRQLVAHHGVKINLETGGTYDAK